MKPQGILTIAETNTLIERDVPVLTMQDYELSLFLAKAFSLLIRIYYINLAIYDQDFKNDSVWNNTSTMAYHYKNFTNVY